MQLFRRSKDGAGDVGSEAARQAMAASDQFGRIVQQGMDQATGALSNVADSSKQAAETANEALGDFRSSLESSVRAQPITALLIAAAAGLAFGALLRPGRD